MQDDYSSLGIFHSRSLPQTFIPLHGEGCTVDGMQISPGIAKLTNSQVKKVQKFEDELEVILIAHEKIPVLSELSKEELKSLKDMEKRMGLTLVAYRAE